MRFDDPAFLLQILPGLLTLFYFAVLVGATYAQAGSRSRGLTVVLLGASVYLVARSAAGWMLVACAIVTLGLAALVERARSAASDGTARALVVIAVLVNVATLLFVRSILGPRSLACGGAALLTCHGIGFVLDVSRRDAVVRSPLAAFLYLVQFPVLPAGPLVRYPDFVRQAASLDRALSVGAFAYGTRRFVVGLFKVMVIADTLAPPADAIFALPASDLRADSAWFGAVCFSLQLYFSFSGYADMGIGLGKMFGLRYPENFRRPYVADSVREFWRRWNITAMMWLRDYLLVPVAERQSSLVRTLPYLVGFGLIGVWHGAGWTLGLWIVYASAWLALESTRFGARLARWPSAFRHLYLLVIVIVGWTIVRAETMSAAWGMIAAMAGVHGVSSPGSLMARLHVTLPVAAAFVTALIGAGPLIPWLSRWRVSVDATTAALVMMVSAVSVFVWRVLRDNVLGPRPGTRT